MTFLIWSTNSIGKFLFLRRIRREIVLYTCLTVCKYPCSMSEFSKTWSFSRVFLKFSFICFCFRIRPMGAEFFEVYGRMDSHHEPNTRFTEICVVPDIHVVYSVNYSMEQSLSREANMFPVVKNFPAMYGIPKFITAVTNARNLSPPWAISIQSMIPHPTSLRSTWILYLPYTVS